jgi:hypothetical protein
MQRRIARLGLAGRHFSASVCALSFAAAAAGAQEPVTLPRLASEIRLDGRIDDPAWQRIASLPMVMQSPNFGEPPSEQTEVRVGYDDHYVYVAAHLYAPPEYVFATSFKRDLFTTATDWFGVCLDTFNDNENALCFYTTPTGLRLDFTVANDAQGSGATDPSWNTFWNVATTQTEEGWFAEMRIPFSSLRFQSGDDGRVVMGLIAARYISRKNEWVIYPSVPPRWGFWSFAKPSQAQRVSFDGVRSRKPVYAAPYLLGGLMQSHRLNGPETEYLPFHEPTREAGLDLKLGLTNSLTLDLTVNTDFAQVEADDQQVNLTRFSLFFPEKRQFFLERASLFDVNIGQRDRIFYSRRIGLHQGVPIPILGGVRMAGRIGGWDVGLLDLQTTRTTREHFDGGSVPSRNFGVARVRRQVLNPYSYVGGIATSRVGPDGEYNLTYGADGIFRLFGNDYLSVAAAQTLTDDPGVGRSLAEMTRVHAQWERRTIAGLGFDLALTRSGGDFEPGVGFLLRRDYTRVGNQVLYGWLPGERSALQRHQIGLNGVAYTRNADGTLETLEIGPSWSGVTKSGYTLEAGVQLSREDLRDSFTLADEVEVPAGSHTYTAFEGSLATPAGRFVRLEAGVNGGTFFDGTLVAARLAPTWIVSRHLELSGGYQANHVRFAERGQELTVHIARARVHAALDTRISASAFAQYSSALEGIVTNVRLRYNPREGNDLYFVYNEGFNTNRFESVPTLPLSSARMLLVKYVHTFAM